MSVLTRTPQNTNTIQPTKYLLVFDRIPNAQYFCQTVNIPGVSTGSAVYNTPVYDINVASNKMAYNLFTIKFLIDEQVQSWQDLYNWFLSYASPQGFDQRNALTRIQNAKKNQGYLTSYSDATLNVLSGLNNPLVRVHFTNMFPVSLGDINFDTTESADTILTADATFMFEYMEFVQL